MSTARTHEPAWPAVCLIIGGVTLIIAGVLSSLMASRIINLPWVSDDFIFASGVAVGGLTLLIGLATRRVAKLYNLARHH